MRHIFLTVLILVFAQSHLKAQDKVSICQTDTLEMILAYEYEGQTYLDDMILKLPELVQYRGKRIVSKDYKQGVYQFVTPMWSDFSKIVGCGFDMEIDSLMFALNPFEKKDSKLIIQKKKGFSDFKYKLFKVQFVSLYIGRETRTIVNIDRGFVFDKETLELDCPVYLMIDILNIESID